MYGSTWADLQVTSSDVSWRMIRSLRSTPPSPARRGERRATFDAALEQAEQLFRAARSVGTAAQPLLSFYGISQAGRAIAAAAKVATNQDFKLVGHGISNGSMSGLHKSGIADLEVYDHGGGSFVDVARFLDSSSIQTPTKIGEIWGILPDLSRFPLPGVGAINSLSLESEPNFHTRSGQRVSLQVRGFPEDVRADAGDPERSRARVTEHLTKYPGLVGWSFRQTDERVPVWRERDVVVLSWPGPNSHEAEAAAISAKSCQYPGYGSLVFPAIAGSQKSSHPLLVWWALLFALSKLARYEPKVWADRIDISTSADAVAIEFMLDRALTVVPELIHRAIEEVAR